MNNYFLILIQGSFFTLLLAILTLVILLVIGYPIAVYGLRLKPNIAFVFAPLFSLILMSIVTFTSYFLAIPLSTVATLVIIFFVLLITVLSFKQTKFFNVDRRLFLYSFGMVIAITLSGFLIVSIPAPKPDYPQGNAQHYAGGLAVDNYIPYRNAQYLIHRYPLGDPEYFGYWTFFDRTPLLGSAGTFLLGLLHITPDSYVFNISPLLRFGFSAYTTFLVFGTIFNALFVIPLIYLLLKYTNVLFAQSILFLILFSPFIIANSFYIWPKQLVVYIILCYIVLLSKHNFSIKSAILRGVLAVAGYMAHPMFVLYLPSLILTEYFFDFKKTIRPRWQFFQREKIVVLIVPMLILFIGIGGWLVWARYSGATATHLIEDNQYHLTVVNYFRQFWSTVSLILGATSLSKLFPTDIFSLSWEKFQEIFNHFYVYSLTGAILITNAFLVIFTTKRFALKLIWLFLFWGILPLLIVSFSIAGSAIHAFQPVVVGLILLAGAHLYFLKGWGKKLAMTFIIIENFIVWFIWRVPASFYLTNLKFALSSLIPLLLTDIVLAVYFYKVLLAKSASTRYSE